MSIFKKRPSPAMIVAISALVVSLAGTAVAGPIAEISLNRGEKKQIRKISRNIAGKVSNRRVTKRAPGLAVARARNAIIANVANAANFSNTVIDDAITTEKIKDAGVTTEDLEDAAVILAKLAENSVDSSKVVDNSLGAADLGPNSVTSSEIATNAVGATEVASNSIDSDEVLDFGLSNQDVGVLFAEVDPNGTLANSSGGVSTLKLGGAGSGAYEVDFGRNVTQCTAVATIGPAGAGAANGEVNVADRGGNAEAVFVDTNDNAGVAEDLPFRLVVVC